MGHYLLDYVHRGRVFTAHALVVTADHAFGGPQRKDDVASVGADVVTADAVPLRHSQSVEGQGGRLLLPVRNTAALVVLPHHNQQNGNNHKKCDTAGDDPNKESCPGAADPARVCLPRVQAQICHQT